MDKSLFKAYICFVAVVLIIILSFIFYPMMISARDDFLAFGGLTLLLLTPFALFLIIKRGIHILMRLKAERDLK